jgi:hypothetical protein
MTGSPTSRGVALVVTLLAVSLLSALGLALALSASVVRLAAANHQQSMALLNAAEAAFAVALRDLDCIADWNSVLDGSQRSAWIDDASVGSRGLVGGVTLDLIQLTNELTCERTTTCSDALVHTSTRARPWAANNPRWQIFVHTPLRAFVDLFDADEAYVAVWVGDEARETDGDPLLDGSGGAGEGRDALRLRAEAFGSGGARRAIEADVTRVCMLVDDVRTCLPGIHVQSWRIVNAAFP